MSEILWIRDSAWATKSCSCGNLHHSKATDGFSITLPSPDRESWPVFRERFVTSRNGNLFGTSENSLDQSFHCGATPSTINMRPFDELSRIGLIAS